MAPEEEIEEIETRLLLEAIHAKYGYDLRGYAMDSMCRRVRTALAKTGLSNLGELQHRLLNDPELFGRLLDDLTVQVSEMFRDPSFYTAFREQVVPLLRTYPSIKIWHAGCAGGEEVYASAILLTEDGLYERAQLYATDVSAAAVERARQGVYTEIEAAAFARHYRAAGGKSEFVNYYSRAYGKIAINEELRRNVVFFQHSLASDHGLGEMQVIFCRNVIIYFGQALKNRTFSMFSDALCRGGFLCLGSSERLSGPHAGAFAEFVGDERIYRLRGGS